METNRPKVGLGVMIRRDDKKILFGVRKGAHEAGVWCIPGGHLEYGETFEQCAAREVLEETGLKVRELKLGTVTNNINKKEGKHYVSIIMVANWAGGEAKIMEPDKTQGWEWFSVNELPSPMCISNKSVFESGFNPFSKY